MMRRMGIEALYRRPNTSKSAPGHKIYPYLLRGLAVDRPNQVWAMDITYIAMARGFVYLAAVIDWFSRRVLAWRVANHHGCRVLPRSGWRRAGQAGSAGDIQYRIRVANSPAPPSPGFCWRTGSPSAWMVAAPGATTCLSSGCGVR